MTIQDQFKGVNWTADGAERQVVCRAASSRVRVIGHDHDGSRVTAINAAATTAETSIAAAVETYKNAVTEATTDEQLETAATAYAATLENIVRLAFAALDAVQ